MSDGVTPHDSSPDPADDDAALVPGGRLRLRVVAAVVAAEGLALGVFAAYLLVNLVAGTDETTETTNTVIETVAFAILAALLVLLARGVLDCRRWTRAPVMVTQLIVLLGPGINIVRGDLWYRFVLGVPLTLAAAVAIFLALTPSATAAIEATEDARAS